jgi:hypothetical protein
MTAIRRSVEVLLICILAGCGSRIDPSLRPYVGLRKDVRRFLAMTLDQQIDTYLKVAALPLKPPDYSLSAIITTNHGDIGQKLAERIMQEKSPDRVRYLIRLAGDYCYLNRNCKGQEFLDAAVKAAAGRFPNPHTEPLLSQNLRWVAAGVAGSVPSTADSGR